MSRHLSIGVLFGGGGGGRVGGLGRARVVGGVPPDAVVPLWRVCL